MSNRPNSNPETPSFEAALASLEAIVHDLEDGDLGLAEALARYEQGIKHLRHCYTLLEQAERKIELLTGIDAEGRAMTIPFAETEPIQAEPAQESTPKPSRRRKPPRTLLDLDDESDDDKSE